jgi:hypothetical protein
MKRTLVALTVLLVAASPFVAGRQQSRRTSDPPRAIDCEPYVPAALKLTESDTSHVDTGPRKPSVPEVCQP